MYLPGGERGWAAVSSIILAVGPVVDGVTPAVASERLETSYKQETVLMVSTMGQFHLIQHGKPKRQKKRKNTINHFMLS